MSQSFYDHPWLAAHLAVALESIRQTCRSEAQAFPSSDRWQQGWDAAMAQVLGEVEEILSECASRIEAAKAASMEASTP